MQIMQLHHEILHPFHSTLSFLCVLERALNTMWMRGSTRVERTVEEKVWVEIYMRKSKFLPQITISPSEAMEDMRIHKQGLSNTRFFLLAFQAGSLELDNSYGP